MSIDNLKYLSEATINDLHINISKNLERYKNGDFDDYVEAGGWDINLSLKVDFSPLENLDAGGGADSEVRNSLLVWNSLHGMSSSLACEDRIWTRLTHVECLEYARDRWLKNVSDDNLIKSIDTHFFANTQTKYRDDNAISRLWWNAYIAKMACPSDQKNALEYILKTADIRSNYIERPKTVSRPVIAAAIIRIMMKDGWLVSKEIHYREFMKELNLYGGGILFEIMGADEIDSLMELCVSKAKLYVNELAA